MKRKLAVILLGAALTITGCGMTAGASETGTETAAEEVITEAESETATETEPSSFLYSFFTWPFSSRTSFVANPSPSI